MHVLFAARIRPLKRRTSSCCPAQQKGRFIGSMIGIRNLHPDQWWGEGEIKVYMDGDTDFPTIVGPAARIMWDWPGASSTHRFCTTAAA